MGVFYSDNDYVLLYTSEDAKDVKHDKENKILKREEVLALPFEEMVFAINSYCEGWNYHALIGLADCISDKCTEVGIPSEKAKELIYAMAIANLFSL